MSQVTLPSSWALLLCACAERRRPSCHFFFFRFRCQPEMPPDAGHDKRESAPATIPVCHVFPAPKPPCPAFTRRGNAFGGKCRRRNTRDRKPCPHDNDGHGTSVTAAGKRGFPLSVAPPFPLSPWRVAPSHVLPPFPFRLSKCMANVPMPPFQTASVVIFVAVAKVIPGLYAAARSGRLAVVRKNLHPRREGTEKVLFPESTLSQCKAKRCLFAANAVSCTLFGLSLLLTYLIFQCPPSQAQVVFCPTNLASPNPYL